MLWGQADHACHSTQPRAEPSDHLVAGRHEGKPNPSWRAQVKSNIRLIVLPKVHLLALSSTQAKENQKESGCNQGNGKHHGHLKWFSEAVPKLPRQALLHNVVFNDAVNKWPAQHHIHQTRRCDVAHGFVHIQCICSNLPTHLGEHGLWLRMQEMLVPFLG